MYALLDAPRQQREPEDLLPRRLPAREPRRDGREDHARARSGRCCSDGTRARPGDASTTEDFGTLEGTLTFKASETEDGVTRVAWAREQRLPGPAQRARRSAARAAAAPARGNIYAAGRQAAELRPDSAPRSPASRARSRPAWSASTTTASAARRSSTLRFGDRVIARVKGRRGTLDHAPRSGSVCNAPRRTRWASELGGIAVIKPGDGSVLALAGLAVSAPQPPGSSFKIITAAAALQHGVAKPSSSYPVRTVGDAVRRQAAQRGRRVLRRLARRTRSRTPATRSSGRWAPSSARSGSSPPPSASASTSSPRSPRPRRARSRRPRTCGQPRRRRQRDRPGQATSPPRSGWPRSAATIANQGVRIKPWLAGKRNAAQARRSAPRSPARCAT